MMNARLSFSLVLAALVGCSSAPAPQPEAPPAASTSTTSSAPEQSPQPASSAEQSADGKTVSVLLCDGETRANFAAGTPGNEIASALMNEWLRKYPGSNWEQETRLEHGLQPAADNKELVGQAQGQTYGRITEQDVALWKTETERLALAGSRVFHSGDELGSTVGVSCDMCHPHAANTHPETYPKFQAQLGRVVLLRDMINWCIQHPVRGTAMSADDPRMRAIEAYIYAQRKGKALEYGKH